MESLKDTRDSLSQMLERVADCDERMSVLRAEIKALQTTRDAFERLACTELIGTGFDKVDAGGRRWSVVDEHRISVTRANRDAVIEAAYAQEIGDEITTVATTTLKSWLKEQAKIRGLDKGASIVEGTAFEGIVSEYIDRGLSSRAVG